MKSFIISQFSDHSLVWMIYSRGLNSKINHFHERALRIVQRDFATSVKGLLDKNESRASHNRNLQQLQI